MKPLDKRLKMCIIATGYGLRATGYGLRATGYGLTDEGQGNDTLFSAWKNKVIHRAHGNDGSGMLPRCRALFCLNGCGCT